MGVLNTPRAEDVGARLAEVTSDRLVCSVCDNGFRHYGHTVQYSGLCACRNEDVFTAGGCFATMAGTVLG
jgi:hypothetical protein